MSQTEKLEFSINMDTDTAKRYNNAPKRQRLRIQRKITQTIRLSLNEVEADDGISYDLTQAFREALPEIAAHLSGKTRLPDAREALKNL